MKVLIVEDIDHKFEEVLAVLRQAVVAQFSVVRAKSVVEATDQIESGGWHLLVLDISMDIAPGSGGATRDGHANLGGMDVIEHMFLLEIETPTIIITGFDYFVKSSSEVEGREAQTLADLEIQARSMIGSRLIGCIRYGATRWEDRLSKLASALA